MDPEVIKIVEWLEEYFFSKVNIVTSFSNQLSNTKVPTEKLVKNSLDNKVDKINGKGLSTNDYDNVSKAKVDTLKDVAFSGSYNDLTNKPTISEEIDVDDSLNVNSDNPVTNSAITTAINGKANTNHTHTKNQITDFPNLSNVAFSGSYDDLINKPEISSSGEIVNIGFGFDRTNKEIYLEFNNE